MKIKTVIAVALGCALLLVRGAAQDKPSQQPTEAHQSVGADVYEAVLDVLMPRDQRDFSNLNKKYGLVLRFRESFGPKLQINVTKNWDGTVEIVKYTISDENIDTKLDDLAEKTGQTDAELLAKSFSSEKRSIKPSRALERLLNRFFDLRLSLDSKYSIVADGTVYEIWFEKLENQAHISVWGSEPGKMHYKNPIIQWMNDVLRAAR